MPPPSCRDCQLAALCRDSAASWIFFIIALVAAVSVRLVNVLLNASQFWAKAFWYIGVIGFAVYFLYKFNLDLRLKRYLEKSRLQEKLNQQEGLTQDEYKALAGLLCNLRSKKEAINYFFIFFTSAIALFLGIYQDFLSAR